MVPSCSFPWNLPDLRGLWSFCLSSQLWDTSTAPGAALLHNSIHPPAPFEGFLTWKLLFIGLPRRRLHFGSREPQHPSLAAGKLNKNMRWAQNPSQEGEFGADPTQDEAPWGVGQSDIPARHSSIPSSSGSTAGAVRKAQLSSAWNLLSQNIGVLCSQ